jgi:hypothetical protein
MDKDKDENINDSNSYNSPSPSSTSSSSSVSSSLSGVRLSRFHQLKEQKQKQKTSSSSSSLPSQLDYMNAIKFLQNGSRARLQLKQLNEEMNNNMSINYITSNKKIKQEWKSSANNSSTTINKQQNTHHDRTPYVSIWLSQSSLTTSSTTPLPTIDSSHITLMATFFKYRITS